MLYILTAITFSKVILIDNLHFNVSAVFEAKFSTI